MEQLRRFVVILLSASLASAACTAPAQRRAWHTFTNNEKLAYLNAEVCLMSKPATTNLPGVKTRFDDFQATHQNQSYAVHNVGAFLPFHRLLMWAHEQALRNECGYEGYQPYWYEQKDAGNFTSSEIFDTVYGFGGDGSGTGKCITNGPFANYTNHLGPSYQITDHCINRAISNMASKGSAQTEVDKCLAQTTWSSAWNCIESVPHSGGHGGVGGEMSNSISSPGDPLFYLHHSWLDKVWWDWQALSLPARLTEMGGNNVARNPFEYPANLPKPTGADGDPANVTTLTHVLNMYGNGPNYTIGDVMNIKGDVLCFEYVEPTL